MPGNRFGQIFSVSTFGESHGPALGAVIDGVPPGYVINIAKIQAALDRRRPGQSHLSSSRAEPDQVSILSGLNSKGMSLGTPIALSIANKDQRPSDYQEILKVFRPSHADYTSYMKYGLTQMSGGGRASARETAARVAAGSIAEQILGQMWRSFSVVAWVDTVYNLSSSIKNPLNMTRSQVDKSLVRCPDPKMSQKFEDLIEEVSRQGDSVGGSIYCLVKGVPPGLGDPVFDKLEADLAKAMLSIPAAKAFEIGGGFGITQLLGSQSNDAFINKRNKISTLTNFSGGVQGGISNGEALYFRVGFKAPSTIFKTQQTVTLKGKNVSFKPSKGRHDPCVLPRAVPIVEAMSLLVIMEHALRQQIMSFQPARK